MSPISKEILDNMKLEQSDSKLHITFPQIEIAEQVEKVFAKATSALVQPVTNKQKVTKLRQIALGVLNYESANRVLPPNKKQRDQNGKSGLSWRVHILPYLGHAALYEQFHLNEPWDSPHNKKLISKIPKVFETSNLFGPAPAIPLGHTTFLAPSGKGTIFGQDKVISLADIVDGTSMTLLVVDVKPELAVPWTAPQDYEFDPSQPSRGLTFGEDSKTISAFCDCSTRSLKKYPEKTWLHLFQRNDGNPIRLD